MTEHENPKRRRGKLIFLGVIVVVACIVAFYQRQDLSIKGWGADLETAQAQAKDSGKIVVALFTGQPPSEVARTIAVRVNATANKEELFGKNSKYIPVCVSINKKSPYVQKYSITKLPTLIAFNPDGSIRNRHEGEIGEVPFRAEFLEYKGKK